LPLLSKSVTRPPPAFRYPVCYPRAPRDTALLPGAPADRRSSICGASWRAMRIRCSDNPQLADGEMPPAPTSSWQSTRTPAILLSGEQRGLSQMVGW
jgi:hypothetical protein